MSGGTKSISTPTNKPPAARYRFSPRMERLLQKYQFEIRNGAAHRRAEAEMYANMKRKGRS
jgi:hypothetical protein